MPQPGVENIVRKWKNNIKTHAMEISPLAEKPAEQNILVNIPRLVTAYYIGKPDACRELKLHMPVPT